MRRMTRAGVTPSLRQAETLCASRIKKRRKGMRGHKQRAGKETALEIPPRVKHVLRSHARRRSRRLAFAGVHGAVR